VTGVPGAQQHGVGAVQSVLFLHDCMRPPLLEPEAPLELVVPLAPVPPDELDDAAAVELALELAPVPPELELEPMHVPLTPQLPPGHEVPSGAAAKLHKPPAQVPGCTRHGLFDVHGPPHGSPLDEVEVLELLALEALVLLELTLVGPEDELVLVDPPLPVLAPEVVVPLGTPPAPLVVLPLGAPPVPLDVLVDAWLLAPPCALPLDVELAPDRAPPALCVLVLTPPVPPTPSPSSWIPRICAHAPDVAAPQTSTQTYSRITPMLARPRAARRGERRGPPRGYLRRAHSNEPTAISPPGVGATRSPTRGDALAEGAVSPMASAATAAAPPTAKPTSEIVA
jgi:hypothetical protein